MPFLDPVAGRNLAPGTWSAVSAAPVPALSWTGLAALALLIGGLGVWRMMRTA